MKSFALQEIEILSQQLGPVPAARRKIHEKAAQRLKRSSQIDNCLKFTFSFLLDPPIHMLHKLWFCNTLQLVCEALWADQKTHFQVCIALKLKCAKISFSARPPNRYGSFHMQSRLAKKIISVNDLRIVKGQKAMQLLISLKLSLAVATAR